MVLGRRVGCGAFEVEQTALLPPRQSPYLWTGTAPPRNPQTPRLRGGHHAGAPGEAAGSEGRQWSRCRDHTHLQVAQSILRTCRHRWQSPVADEKTEVEISCPEARKQMMAKLCLEPHGLMLEPDASPLSHDGRGG